MKIQINNYTHKERKQVGKKRRQKQQFVSGFSDYFRKREIKEGVDGRSDGMNRANDEKTGAYS